MSNYELYAKIGGDSSNLTRSLGKARKSIGLTSNGLKKMAGVGLAAFKGLSVAAGGAVASLGALTRSGLQFVDEQAKLARALNTTTESLRGVQVAAEEAGLRDFEMSLERLARRLGAASDSGTAYAKVVEKLNLDLAELNDLPLDERLATIADAFAASGMSMQEAARAAQELGFEQAKAVTFFMRGGDVIRETSKRVREYGNAISSVESAMVERANDALNEMKQALEAVRIELAVQFAGALTAAANRFMEMGKAAGGFRSLVRPAIESVINVIGILGDSLIEAYREFLRLRLALSNVIDDLARFKKVADFLNPFNTAIGLLSDGIGALADVSQDSSQKTKALKEQLENVPERGKFSEFLENAADDAEQLARSAESATNATRQMAESAVPSMLRRPDDVPDLLRRGPESPSLDFVPAYLKGFEQITDAAESASMDMTAFMQSAGANIQTALANFLVNPFKDGLKGMLSSFINVINRMVAEIAASQILMAFFGQFAGQSGIMGNIASGMGIQSPTPSSHTGTLATGGPMMARQPYMVGEKGPEMVVPNKSSYVVPNNKLGGGGGTSLNVTVNAEDPGAEGRIRTMIERDMAPQIIEAATGRTLNRLSRPAFA